MTDEEINKTREIIDLALAQLSMAQETGEVPVQRVLLKNAGGLLAMALKSIAA